MQFTRASMTPVNPRNPPGAELTPRRRSATGRTIGEQFADEDGQAVQGEQDRVGGFELRQGPPAVAGEVLGCELCAGHGWDDRARALLQSDEKDPLALAGRTGKVEEPVLPDPDARAGRIGEPDLLEQLACDRVLVGLAGRDPSPGQRPYRPIVKHEPDQQDPAGRIEDDRAGRRAERQARRATGEFLEPPLALGPGHRGVRG